ncbi:MAG: PadR family transcriptional regulator [Candidatus Geothermarchaeales archaeon]
MSGLRKEYVEDFLESIVLDLLDERAMHSYGIIAAIHERFHFLISPSTLFPLLTRLEEEGLISAEGDFSSGRKKTYTVTRKGSAESARLLEALARLSEEALGFRGEKGMRG